MLWNKNRVRAALLKDQEYERRHFEGELREIFKTGDLTLALARMTFAEEYTFRPKMDGAPLLSVLRCDSGAPCFFGVVRESSGSQPGSIWKSGSMRGSFCTPHHRRR